MLVKVKNLISNKKFIMISKILLGVIVIFFIIGSSYMMLNKKDNTKVNEVVDIEENIAISQNKTSLVEGEEYQLEVNKKEDVTLTWSSSDKSIATVSASGLVTTTNAGTATITAKSSNGKTTTITLNVTIPNSCFSMSGTIITGYKKTDNACKTNAMNIPSSLGATEIEGSAFTTLQLMSVTIPNSVTKIEGSAFYNNKLKT